ncbi:MAG: signal recognition particle-docking protein FtsY [Desulfobacterales bacterium]|nr:MAG: signal recognition particle-docking protein FtsY [Desulfobacterales bacterium]
MAFGWLKKKGTKKEKEVKDIPDHIASDSNEIFRAEDENQVESPEENVGISHPEPEKEMMISADPDTHEAVKIDSEKSPGLFNRLRNGLTKTRKLLSTDIEELFAGNRQVDEELLEELEELLITSDIGVQTTIDLIQSLTKKSLKISTAEQLKETLKEKIKSIMVGEIPDPQKIDAKPHVIMVIGVNGVGKTTTIGKLASKFMASGEKVLIAAADTFRAAAVEQLEIWAERAGVDIIKHKQMTDPAAVVYDGIEAAIARNADIVLIDTAGRLHTKKNLMEELKKVKRTIAKKIPEAPHEILLILDATTGQNALSQAKLFNEVLGVTGIALTKLDGTAKGGIVVSICSTLDIPLKYIGIGEKIDDLQEFDPVRFVNALL